MTAPTMTKRISEDRQAAYYLGLVVMIVGGLMFASVFVTAAMRFGDFSNFEANARSEMFRALGGMGLLFVGGIIRLIAARGLADSGVVFARRDDYRSTYRGYFPGDHLRDCGLVHLDVGTNEDKSRSLVSQGTPPGIPCRISLPSVR
jgi:hypothetical protein